MDSEKIRQKAVEMLAQLLKRPAFEIDSLQPSELLEIYKEAAFTAYHGQLVAMLIGALLRHKFGIGTTRIFRLRSQDKNMQILWSIGMFRPLTTGTKYLGWLLDNDAFNFAMAPECVVRLFRLYNRDETRGLMEGINPKQLANLMTRHNIDPKGFVRFTRLLLDMMRQLQPWPQYDTLIAEVLKIALGEKTKERARTIYEILTGDTDAQEEDTQGEAEEPSGEP
ncbi:MAG: hypothetical protein JRD89_00225 [Deltaproteobacteria bacterium]|nr:hypothetical protein [Deltaproteobacteria bacterium]